MWEFLRFLWFNVKLPSILSLKQLQHDILKLSLSDKPFSTFSPSIYSFLKNINSFVDVALGVE